jgi:hypothetical protein
MQDENSINLLHLIYRLSHGDTNEIISKKNLGRPLGISEQQTNRAFNILVNEGKIRPILFNALCITHLGVYEVEHNIQSTTEVQKVVETTPSPSSYNSLSETNNYENSVFVSYAWGGESERTVNELEKAFSQQGINIVRDKRDLEYKDSIEAFERRISKGQCVVIVISDKYLRSEHCMYELVELQKNQNMRAHVFPIVLSDAKIYKAVERLSYIKHWDMQIEQLNQAIKQVDVMTNLSGISADLDKYARIRASFDYLIDLLSDMNTLTPDVHRETDFSILITAVKQTMIKK